MNNRSNLIELDKTILNSKNILFIQDIDGVCIPLVKDPMKRALNKEYILAANKLNKEFYVLTCGEHEGERGVNRIIERSLESKLIPKNNGLYLRGLAACGVEYQNNFGKVNFEGISKKELKFLSKVPEIMRPKFKSIVKDLFPNMNESEISYHSKISICDTRFSPTINFNSLFEILKFDFEKKRIIQSRFMIMMNEIINEAEKQDLKDTFFLHISPNLGANNGIEILKKSTKNDIGSTDIQFLLKGAKKDNGVLCLLNKFIGDKSGKKPFGENFNFRDAPKTSEEKIDFLRKHINEKDMPLIIGVGDTITSFKDSNNDKYSRGGSDRSFLEFIQRIGVEYGKENKIIFVDSSFGEVYRPSTKETGLLGISDEEDKLKFNFIFENGPIEYINWFIKIANKRKKINETYK